MTDGSLPAKPIASSNQAKPRFVNLIRPGKLDVEFTFECIKSLNPWSTCSGLYVKSEKGMIEETFAGVCLAVPKDEAATEMTLGIVSELGVKAVRIDLSESNTKKALIPLLEGLQRSRVSVLLHLVQPLAQAKQMPNLEANEAWKCFVSDALASFSEMIEAVEIGTTVNRAKWAGYTLDGFISAWETAYPLVRASGLPLIGPNVTDFEPQYNAGLLGMLKRRQCLPDIHSNNMFAERAIQPEAIDRKILGEWLKRFHGYDHIKKLRLVASIARRNGVSRNWSTCAFWTLPRIQRILVSSEEQMADYLTRYFVLCASEGSFERFYWGPLVSRREGLLDDGTGLPEDRSLRDVVSYYSELPGESEQWRHRPALYAFKTIQSMLSGARYLQRLSGKKGLEVHLKKATNTSMWSGRKMVASRARQISMLKWILKRSSRSKAETAKCWPRYQIIFLNLQCIYLGIAQSPSSLLRAPYSYRKRLRRELKRGVIISAITPSNGAAWLLPILVLKRIS